jgi:hydroxyacylglutathione hydrolase
MVSLKTFCFNLFDENSYLIFQPGGDCVFVDPGNYENEEFDTVRKFIEDQALKPRMIINTHCHVDHVLGVVKLKNHYKIPFFIHRLEMPVLTSVRIYAPTFGLSNYCEPRPDGFLVEGQIINIADSSWEVLLVPGHSPGHIALLERTLGKCLTGDILFRESIGRTDLPGGNYNTLIKGIKEKLFILPDEVEVYSGHGPGTTIGYEKENNPFLRN